MSRNFGLGQRNMAHAGAVALRQAQERGALSYASVDKYSQSWKQFTCWAKEHGVNRMEHVSPELVKSYGQRLSEMVQGNSLKASTAQNLVTAVNKVMHLATGTWSSVKPTLDAGIPQRSNIRATAPAALNREHYEARLKEAEHCVGSRAIAVCELARELGLRSKEASLLNAVQALQQAKTKGVLVVRDGTKGGRFRRISITSERQLKALERAAAAQGNARSVMPPEVNWVQWREGELRQVREVIGGLHELRSAFACERYAQITGFAAVCTGGKILDKQKDLEARQTISLELGHDRIEVVAEYVGGRK